jgi:hypothetical protein
MRVLLFLFALVLSPTASAQTLADLAWLKGCWRTQGDGPVVTEVWLAPPMPALLGYSYTQRAGETRGWEQTRIEMLDGRPHFIAMPNGGPPVRFRMREMAIDVDDPAAEAAIFENPQHDYPQTVEYRRIGNQLIATIANLDGSDAFTFTYRRIRCDASLRP